MNTLNQDQATASPALFQTPAEQEQWLQEQLQHPNLSHADKQALRLALSNFRLAGKEKQTIPRS